MTRTIRRLWSLSLLLPMVALVRGIPSPRQPRLDDTITLPPLPICDSSQPEDGYDMFRHLWSFYTDDNTDLEDSGLTCPRKFIIMIPSEGALHLMIPQDRANPFVTDDLLRHLTVFSHVFSLGWNVQDLERNGEAQIYALNGAEVKIEKVDGELYANSMKLSLCPDQPENECTTVYRLDGVLEVTRDDVEFAISHPSSRRTGDIEEQDDDTIVFRDFELPILTPAVEKIMREELDGNTLADIWKTVSQYSTTRPLEIEEMMLLVPSDNAFRRMIPELKPNVPSPLEEDVQLQRHILSNHIIIQEGTIPSELLRQLPEYLEVIKINMRGQTVVFHREDTKGGGSVIKVNGEAVESEFKEGATVMLGLNDVLFKRASEIDASVERMAEKVGESEPYPEVKKDKEAEIRAMNPFLTTTHVPKLKPEVSYALRSVGAGRFASIWLDLKAEAQQSQADAAGNSCLLPKESGPCKQAIGQFYYDSDLGRCAPFVWGGCEGNANRFGSLLECTEQCVTDMDVKINVRERTCKLPVYQYQNLVRQVSLRQCKKETPVKKFHYNQETDICEEESYTGCFGTDNLFDTVEECQKICKEPLETEPLEIPPRSGLIDGANGDDICSMPAMVDTPVQRACDASIPMWTFNSDIMTCEPVLFNSCGGTGNLFETEDQCLSRCGGRDQRQFLNIYAPTDAALEELLARVGYNQEVFRSNPFLARKLVLSTLSYEECNENTDTISSLNRDEDIVCEGENIVRNVFEGVGYRIHVTKNVKVNEDEIRAFAKDIPSAQFRDIREQGHEKPAGDGDSQIPALSEETKAALESEGLIEFVSQWQNSIQPDDKSEEDSAFPLHPTCYLIKDEGVQVEGVEPVERYAYDEVSGFCRPFSYLGSGGNENNFGTYEECIEICGEFQGLVATVDILRSTDLSTSLGVLTMTQSGPDQPVVISGSLTGLAPGLHGFHVHQNGDLSDSCKAAGGHFNPFGATHGAPTDAVRHVGDLGNIETLEGIDETPIDIIDNVISLYDEMSGIIGKAIVVHEGEDDLGQGGNNESLITGNAGPRFACGLIESSSSVMRASVALKNGLEGTLNMEQKGPMAPVRIRGTVSGLEEGHHGFHIHEGKEIGDDCLPAKGHFNPFMMNHGSPGAEDRHVGDLGNIFTSDPDSTIIDKLDFHASLYPGLNNAMNRTIVIHAGRDDLGLGGDEGSLKTGNAGGRVGCGIIRPQPVQNIIVAVTDDALEKDENMERHLATGTFIETAEQQTFKTISGDIIEVTMKDDGQIFVDGIEVMKMTRSGNNVILIIGEPLLRTRSQNLKAEDSDMSFMKPVHPIALAPKRPLTLPEQTSALKEAGAQVKVSTFFRIWDAFLKTEVGNEDKTITDVTLVTMDDQGFRDFIPVGIDPNPLYEVDRFQRTLLANTIIPQRIDPNDERIKSEEGLTVKTIGNFLFKFKYVNDVLTIQDIPVKAIQSSPNSVIYVVDQLINVTRESALMAAEVAHQEKESQ